MTTGQVTIIVLTILILTGCRYGYSVDGDKVYYEYWNEGSGQHKQLIEQADAESFQKLTFDCGCSFEFGKDKEHLFIDGELISNVDPNTFQFIGNYMFRDKDSAYFFGFYNSLNDCVVRGVNPDKIKLIKYPWAKADNLLIHGRDTVDLDDISDFIPIDDDWGKTKKHIVNDKQILYGADVPSFKTTSSFEGKDKNYNYEFGAIKEGDFKNTSYRTFDFAKNDFCQIEPLVFADVYDSLVSYTDDRNKPVEIVEKLKQRGFTVSNMRYLDWAGESKIIRASMTSNSCNCVVEKLYRYDYGKPSETKNIFKVTERIHCDAKEKQNSE